MTMLNTILLLTALAPAAESAAPEDPAAPKAEAQDGDTPTTSPFAEQPDPRAPPPAAASPFDRPLWGEGIEPDPTEQPQRPPPVDRGSPPPTASHASAAVPSSPTPATADPMVQRQARVYPRRPIRYRLGAFVGGGTSLFRDPAYRAFSDGRTGANTELGARADFRLGETRGFLGMGATFRRLVSSGDMYNGLITTTLRIEEPVFFVRASVALADGVDVYLEPGAGPSVINIRMQSTELGRQKIVRAMINGLGGVTVYLPKRWLPRRGSSRVTAGVDLGFGYTWRSTLRAALVPDTDDEPIDTEGVDLGHMSLRGFTWRLSAFIRFM